jgi:hypothetical protein
MRTRLLMTALVLTTLAGSALAQTQPAKTDDSALQGPAVKEAGVPGESRQFADGKAKHKERLGTEIPHPLFMRALEVLRGDSADASVRLTADQDSKIKAISQAFTDSVSQYRQDHMAEARDLIQQFSPEDRKKAQQFLNREGRGQDGKAPKLGDKAKGKGKAPEAPTATDDANSDSMTGTAQVDPKKSEEAKAKLRELFEGAPKPADTHAQIFGVLTDTQKPVFQKELDRLKKEMEDRSGAKRAERKAAQKSSGTNAKPAPSTSSDVNVPDPK